MARIARDGLHLLLPLSALLLALEGTACAGSPPAAAPAAATRQGTPDGVATPATPVRAMTLEAPQLMARQTSGSAQAGGSPAGAGAGATGQDLSGSRFSAARWLEPDATERSPAAAAAQAGPPARHHEVFGFAPYWTLSDQQGFDVSNLSTIAYFGVDVGTDGSLVQSGAGWTGFQNPALTDLVARAHASQTRVVLVAKSFDPAVLHRLGSDPSAADRLAGQLTEAVRWKGMDGVNLDFEGGDGADRAGFTAFVTRLAQGLHTAGAHWQVTLDTYASAALDRTGMVDVAAIAPAVDGFFVMAYDMNSSATPSPTAPLNGRDWNDTRAMTSYTAAVPASKVILGIPFYGYQWPTSDGSRQARALGTARAVSYGQLAASRPPVQWDDTAAVPWTAYQDASGQWWQAYFDDPQSVALKSDLADHMGLAGVGVWALGMEGGDHEMMAALLGLSPAFKDPFASSGIARGGAPVFPTTPSSTPPANGPGTSAGSPSTAAAPRPAGGAAQARTQPTQGPAGSSTPAVQGAPPAPIEPQSGQPVQPTPTATPAPTTAPVPVPSAVPTPAPTTPPTAQPIRVEAESLQLAASPATTAPHSVQQGVALSGGGQLLIQPTAPGQQVSLQLQVPTAGTYQLLVNPSFGPRYGTWSVAVDGKSLGDCNGYAPTAASPANASVMGKVALAAGTHSLTFVVNGKDPRSTGYLAGIDRIELIPN
jgi:hypothetical protein